jgi:hypothetical protein
MITIQNKTLTLKIYQATKWYDKKEPTHLHMARMHIDAKALSSRSTSMVQRAAHQVHINTNKCMERRVSKLQSCGGLQKNITKDIIL